MADLTDQSKWQNPLGGLLASILGGDVDQDTTKSESTTGTTKTTGTSSQTTSGTSKQVVSADLQRLADVYKRQSQGVTPEMLTQIFTQGAKAVPSLTTSYANAVGARSSNNTPLAVSIRDLQAELTGKAAELNTKLLEDAGITAGRIGELTRQTTTSGSDTTTKTDNSTQNNNATTTGNTQMDQKSTANTDVLKVLGGTAAGASLLDVLLGGNGRTGGLNDVFSAITGVGKGIGGIKTAWDSIFGANTFDVDWGGIFSDPGVAGFDWDSLGSLDDLASLGTNSGWTDFFDFGWADGGKITADKSTAKMTPQARQDLAKKVMVFQQLLKTGQTLLETLVLK
jgi:hypothetical protein